MFDLIPYLERQQARVDAFLKRRLPPATTRPAVLHKAMRYSVLAGGKRFRPVLAMAAAQACGKADAPALAAGAAVELLHTYTLIHDDLPCMDDDALRRGKPTCHVAFGEANALLAGDALQTLAFEWLAALPQSASPARLTVELARAAGSQGVIGGQVEDLLAEGSRPSKGRLDYIHLHKTAVLIEAAARLGAIAGGAAEDDIAKVGRYGLRLGVAFQVADDILNATSTPEALGKPVGSDKERGKLTFVALHGLRQSRSMADSLVREAQAALKGLPGETAPLRALADYVVRRKK
ncbi:MAG: polyprenyl synthetase family protein [Kiritimatiellia bacterium]